MLIAEVKTFGFTPRETDVARLVAKGKARKSIAGSLKISIHTLDDYLAKIRHNREAQLLRHIADIFVRQPPLARD